MKPDSLREYLNAIGSLPLLTADQEIELARKIQPMLELKAENRELTKEEKRIVKIGERAKKKMFECNLRLVVSVARRYTHRLVCNSMDLLDLIQEGNIGLDRAVEKFDHTRGYKFSTYSYWWIRQSISRGIDMHERAIRIPGNALEKSYKAKRFHHDFQQMTGRPPTVQETADHLGTDVENLRMILERSTPHSSLDTKLTDDGNSFIEIIADTYGIDSDYTQDELNELIEKFQVAFEQLNEHHQTILNCFYGLNGEEEMALTKIAEKLGVSRESVRQQRLRAERTLKIKMNLFVAQKQPLPEWSIGGLLDHL